MSKRGIPEKIKKACKDFVIQRKLPLAQYGILLKLALKSYKNLPLEERDSWTLQAIMDQGL